MGIKNNQTKVQAHGMTVAEVENLRLKQAGGEKPKMIDANVDSNYKIQEHEAGLVHVLLEKEEWLKGKKLSKGVVKKFHENDFRAMSKTNLSKGEKGRARNAFSEYDVITVVHDPSKGKKVSAIVNPESDDFTEKVEDMTIEQLAAKYYDLSGEINETSDREELIKLIRDTQAASL